MSHINEALKKAQKERDAHHLKYQGLFAARGKTRRVVRGKVLWWTLACLFLIVIVFKYNPWMGDTVLRTITEFEKKIKKPVQEPVTQATKGPEGKTKKPAPGPGSVTQTRKRPEGDIKKPVPGPGSVTQTRKRPEGNIKKPAPGPGPVTQTRIGSEAKVKKPEAKQKPTGVEKARESYNRAKIFHRRGRVNQAKRLYQETLKSDPGHVDALNNLGVIFIQEGNYPAAQRHFEKAMRLKPAYAEPFYNLACLHAIKGEVKQGLALLERAVSIDTTARDWARKDSDLANLRGTPEFETIVGK